MRSAQQVEAELITKRRELAAIFDGSKRDNTFALTDEQLADVQTRNADLEKLHDEYVKAVEVEGIYEKNAKAQMEAAKLREPQRPASFPGTGGDGGGQAAVATLMSFEAPKSIGEQFVASVGFKEYNPSTKHGPAVELDFERKTTMTEGSSWAQQAVRTPRIVDYALRRVTVPDLLPQGTTNQIAIVYMEETTFTNNAAAVAEGGTKPEAALALTERTAPVRKIAVTLPVTDELMMDQPALRAYIDARLTTMLELKEEDYILNGTGVAPEIGGILANGSLQTQAKGADPVPTAIYKAIVKIQTTAYSEPSGYVTNPLDWQDIVTLQDTTGRYIWGDPSAVQVQRIWGLPVVSTTAMTQNTGLVGDFAMGAMIFRRQGITIEVTNSNEDDFKKNILRIRAEERLALAIWRGAAFCQVTGI